MQVYLDNGATTKLSREVFDEMRPYFDVKYGNASSLHRLGREAMEAIEKSREIIAKKMYGADRVIYTVAAEQDIKLCEELKHDNLPVCIAKTQYSLSDDPKCLGRPKDFKITVREIKFSAGAGFLVALTGKITTMPGLPEKPASENINIDDNWNITGLE